MKFWELKCKDKAESLRRSVGMESFLPSFITEMPADFERKSHVA